MKMCVWFDRDGRRGETEINLNKKLLCHAKYDLASLGEAVSSLSAYYVPGQFFSATMQIRNTVLADPFYARFAPLSEDAESCIKPILYISLLSRRLLFF